ncbi:MAG: hypothetical protein ABEJ26_05265 [Halosimplex sp.]
MPSAVVFWLLAGGLAAVHVFAGKLRYLQVLPRSRYLSAAGGVSIAYVFVHLLPEITERQLALSNGADTTTPLLGITVERELFLVALAGFALFYGLERFVVRSQRATDGQAVAPETETNTSVAAFWLHMGSFAVYNALVGYLLVHREETGLANLLFFFSAMALHFFVNDYGLREHHREAYTRLGRWILAGAVVAGLGIGFLVDVREVVLGLLLAFLGGGVILNVVKEELPEERESSYWAFGAGVIGYTLVLLLL